MMDRTDHEVVLEFLERLFDFDECPKLCRIARSDWSSSRPRAFRHLCQFRRKLNILG
jgi:hypothetical protein